VWFGLKFTSDEDSTGIVEEEHEQLRGAFVDDINLLLSNAEPAPAITTDPFSCRQWGLHNMGQSGGEPGWDINIEPAWTFINEEFGSLSFEDEDSIVVAVIDEGVDLDHEDLNIVAGYDATYDPDDPQSVDSHGGANPRNGHGTACAGIIGAKNNGIGIVGVAPGVKIMPVRITYTPENGSRVFLDSDSAEGILWAADNGAQVLSNSWGSGSDADIIHNAIRDAKDMGSILVFSTRRFGGLMHELHLRERHGRPHHQRELRPALLCHFGRRRHGRQHLAFGLGRSELRRQPDLHHHPRSALSHRECAGGRRFGGHAFELRIHLRGFTAYHYGFVRP
jgi:hypothetical protein